jgi:hypothetical protein
MRVVPAPRAPNFAVKGTSCKNSDDNDANNPMIEVPRSTMSLIRVFQWHRVADM